MVNKYAHVTGGADLNCLALAEVLRRRGHQVALLSTASPRNVFSEGEFIAASVTGASREQLGVWSQVEVARRAIWNPSAAAATRRLIASFRPHVVHAHKLYPQLSCAPVIAAARAKVPIVQTLHDYEFLAASYRDHRGRWIDRDETRLSFRALNTATYVLRRRLHAREGRCLDRQLPLRGRAVRGARDRLHGPAVLRRARDRGRGPASRSAVARSSWGGCPRRRACATCSSWPSRSPRSR